MARIGQLFVELSLKANEFSAGLKQMQKEAKEFEKSIRPIKDTLLDIGTPMVAVGGVVTTAFIAMAKQAANFGDSIRDASIRTGVSTEALGGLKLAAEQTGTSFEGINAGLIKMSKAALATTQTTKETGNAFKSIGVAVKDASGQLRPMEAILADVADKFAKMKDGTEKAALAQQLFGRGGATMIEFLNQGKEGLAAFQKQAEEMGLALSQDAANAADNFNDSLNALTNAQLGLSQSIGAVLLPGLTKMVNMITGAVVEFRKFTAAHPELTKAIFILAGALTGAGGLLVGLAGVLLILPQLATAFTILTGPIGLAVAAVGAFVAAMYAFPKFRGIVSDTLKNVIGLFALLGSQLGSVGEALMELAKGQFSAAWNTIKTAGTKSVDDMTAALDGYDAAIKAAGNITGAFNTTASKTASTLLDEFVPSLDKTEDAASKAKKKLDELVQSARVKLSGELPQLIDNLNYGMERSAKEFSQLMADKIDLLARKLKFLDDMEKAFRESSFRANQDLMKDLDRVTKQTVSGILEASKKQEEAAKKNAEALKQATNDVKQSAGKVFDDMFVKGENVFKSLANLLKGGALSLGRAVFEDVAGALLGPIKKAFDDFFSGLLEGVGLKSLISGLGQKLGGALSSIIPGGGAVSTVASQLPGSVQTAAGGAASAASGGAGAFAGAGSAVIGGAISGIGSFLGSMRLEGTMNAVEANTRFTYIELRDTMDQILQPMKGTAEQSRDFLEEIRNIAAAQELETQGILNNSQAGGTGGTSGPITIEVTAPFTINSPFTINGSDITDLTVRDIIMPKWMNVIDTGVRGYKEHLARTLQDVIDGLTGTKAAVGI